MKRYLTPDDVRALPPGDVLHLAYDDLNQGQFVYTHKAATEDETGVRAAGRAVYPSGQEFDIVLYQFDGPHRSDPVQASLMVSGSGAERVFFDEERAVAESAVQKLLEADDLDPEEIMSQTRSAAYAALTPEGREIYDAGSQELRDAIENGGTFREPNENYEWNGWPSYDDDIGWTEIVYTGEYVVVDGVLELHMEEGDRGGNREMLDSVVVGSRDYHELIKDTSLGTWKIRVKDYAQWVAEHGEDPIGWYSKPERPQATEKWLLGFVRDGDRVRFAVARNILSQPPSPPPVNDLTQLPPYVKEWARLDDQGYIQEMTWDEFQVLDDIKLVGNYWVAEVTDQPPPPPLDPEAEKEHYKRLATEDLARWKKPKADEFKIPYWS